MTGRLLIPDQRRQIADLERRLGVLERRLSSGTVPSRTSGQGNFPLITVAAVNTPSSMADAADYICDGAADQVEIQAALADGPAVLLLPGNYETNGVISISGDRTLIGSGRELTVIDGSGSSDATVKVLNGELTMRDLWVSNGSGSRQAVYVTSTSGSLVMESCRASAISGTSLPAMELQGVAHLRNSRIDGSTPCLAAVILGAPLSSMVGCDLHDRGLIVSGGNCVVMGNAVNAAATGPAILIDSGGSNGNVVVGNLIEQAAQHGISLFANPSDNLVHDNRVYGYAIGAGSAIYDGIRIDGDQNSVQGNVIRKGTAVNPRHAINVVSGATDNLVTNNDLAYSVTALAALNDSGTGTITAAGNRT